MSSLFLKTTVGNIVASGVETVTSAFTLTGHPNATFSADADLSLIAEQSSIGNLIASLSADVEFLFVETVEGGILWVDLNDLASNETWTDLSITGSETWTDFTR